MTARVSPQVARRVGQRTCRSSNQAPLKYPPILRSPLIIGLPPLRAFLGCLGSAIALIPLSFVVLADFGVGVSLALMRVTFVSSYFAT